MPKMDILKTKICVHKATLTLMATQLMFYKNHMIMLILIIFMSLLLSSLVYLFTMNHWFSLMMVMIYVSGIMVLFMFIISLSPNEKNPMKTQTKFAWFLLVNVCMISTKPSLNPKLQEMNSFFQWNFTLMVLCLTMIILTAYLPPKMMKSFLKGMKSSK